jgi:hypothetical protein
MPWPWKKRGGGAMTNRTPESILANLGQMFLILLFVYPDEPGIIVPRAWVGDWYRDVSEILQLLREGDSQ